MYFVILKDKAIGPFNTRTDAYRYAYVNLRFDLGEEGIQFVVVPDAICQNRYLHLPIEAPK